MRKDGLFNKLDIYPEAMSLDHYISVCKNLFQVDFKTKYET